MSPLRKLIAALAMFGIMAVAPARSESFHTCGTIVASVPAVIGASGVYCLSHDLNTAITFGNAILIQANNVTLDCNGYKIGGLAAGVSSTTLGVAADDTRLNISIRNCNIRGFKDGIYLGGGSGHLVEDNRLDNNLLYGVYVGGDNNRVQRNRIYDTGGSTGSSVSFGIYASADVIDNTVSGVFAVGSNPFVQGIQMLGDGTTARDNEVRGLVISGTGEALGINVNASAVTVRNNAISSTAAIFGKGIAGMGPTDTFCTGNTIAKYSTPIFSCQADSTNLTN